MGSLIELRGHTALVTGGGRRIGAALCGALARAGVDVVVHYHRSAAEAESVAADTRAQGVRAFCVQGDLADPENGAAVFARAVDAAGPIDFLINNASIFPAQTWHDMNARDVIENMNVNALAPFALARSFAAQARGGAIVNMLDARMDDYDRAHVPYHLSKRTLYSLTHLMAIEYAPGIRVNGVAPGLVLPPEGKDEGYLAALAHTTLLQRYGDVDGVCEAVLFLLRSTFITGQIVYVDGGRNLRGALYG